MHCSLKIVTFMDCFYFLLYFKNRIRNILTIYKHINKYRGGYFDCKTTLTFIYLRDWALEQNRISISFCRNMLCFIFFIYLSYSLDCNIENGEEGRYDSDLSIFFFFYDDVTDDLLDVFTILIIENSWLWRVFLFIIKCFGRVFCLVLS